MDLINRYIHSAHPNSTTLDASLMRPLKYEDRDKSIQLKKGDQLTKLTIEGPDGDLTLEDLLPHLAGAGSLALHSIPEDDGGISLSKTDTPMSERKDSFQDELQVPAEIKRANSDPFPWMQYPTTLYGNKMRRCRSMSDIEDISKLQFDFLDLSEIINDRPYSGGPANSTEIENFDKRRHTITNPNSLQYMTSLIDLDGRSLSQDDLYYLKDKMNALDDMMKEKPNHVTKVINLADEVHWKIEQEERSQSQMSPDYALKTFSPANTSEVPILVDDNSNSFSNAFLISSRDRFANRRVSFVPELEADEQVPETTPPIEDNNVRDFVNIAPLPPLVLMGTGSDKSSSKTYTKAESGRSQSSKVSQTEPKVAPDPRKTKSGAAKIDTYPTEKVDTKTILPVIVPRVQDAPKTQFWKYEAPKRTGKRPVSLPILGASQKEDVRARQVKSGGPTFPEIEVLPVAVLAASKPFEYLEKQPQQEVSQVEELPMEVKESEKLQTRPSSYPVKNSEEIEAEPLHEKSWPSYPLPVYVEAVTPSKAAVEEVYPLQPGLSMESKVDTTLSASYELNPGLHRMVSQTSTEAVNGFPITSKQQTELEPVEEVIGTPSENLNFEANNNSPIDMTGEIYPMTSREPSKLQREPTSPALKNFSILSSTMPERESTIKSTKYSSPIQAPEAKTESARSARTSPRFSFKNDERSLLNMSIGSITEEPELEEKEKQLMDNEKPNEAPKLNENVSFDAPPVVMMKSRIPRKMSSNSLASIENKKFTARQTSTPKDGKPIASESPIEQKRRGSNPRKTPIKTVTAQQRRSSDSRKPSARDTPKPPKREVSDASDLEITQSTINPQEFAQVQADPTFRKRFLDSVNTEKFESEAIALPRNEKAASFAPAKPATVDRATSFIFDVVTKNKISQTEVENFVCNVCATNEQKDGLKEDGSTQTLAWRGGIVRSNTIVKKDFTSTDSQTSKPKVADKSTMHEQELKRLIDKATSPVNVPTEKPLQVNEATETVESEDLLQTVQPQAVVFAERKAPENDYFDETGLDKTSESQKRTKLEADTSQRDFGHQATFDSIRLMMSPNMLDEMQGLDQFQKECLLSHNLFRVKHRAPPAKWSPSLSRQAQQWANYLVATNTLQHSNEQGYSENVLKKRLRRHEAPRGFGIIQNWYKGGRDYDFSAGGKQKLNRSLQAFVKLVWQDVEEIGVGYSFDNEDNIVVVGHYKPKVFIKNIATNVLPKL